jgi:AraC-like DNA-binding protein
MKIGSTLFAVIVFLVLSVTAAGESAVPCARFIAPAQKSMVTAPVCSLGVDTGSCKRIVKAEISVRYFPSDSDTAIVVTLPKVYHAPFVQPWDIGKIPNQLFIGIGTIIDVTFSDGETARMRREGIFLTHRQVDFPPPLRVPYEFQESPTFTGDTVHLPFVSSSLTFAQLYWNETAITMKVHVADTLFHLAAPETVLDQMGIEILLDPSHKRRPYPTEDVMIFVVPLSGKPYRVTYKPVFGDSGNYRLDPLSVRGNFTYNIERNEGKGFSVTFSVPYFLFGKALPQEMGCNIIAKSADAKGKIVAVSLINAKGYNNYSPFLWGTLTVDPKPLGKNRWLVLLAAFIGGLCIPVLIHFLTIAIVKDRPGRLILMKRSKEEDTAFERIKKAIDHQVIRRDLSLKDIAGELNVSPKKLAAIIKKVAGLSFKKYLMYLRTEIVCERLRSSHSSEVTIAETCGFKNVKEMESYFRKFHHMTPFHFRRMQQITQGQ